MSDIITRVDGDGTAFVTLNRPHKRNAVNFAMWRELGDIFGRMNTDDKVRVVVLTGAGGYFSAGADISEFSENRASAEQGEEYERVGFRCEKSLKNLTKPTIAAIEGFCIGGGLGLAVCCDFRIARTNAQFGIPAARLGIVYGVFDTRNLVEAVGFSGARRILFTAARLDAMEAKRLGLIDELVEGPVLERAAELARSIAMNAPLSVSSAKTILLGLASWEVGDLHERADALIARALESEDYKEGVQAFSEKRAPRFRGR